MFGHLLASFSNSARVILRHELPPNRSDMPTTSFLVPQRSAMLANSAVAPVLTAATGVPPSAACVELLLHAVSAMVSTALAASAAVPLRSCIELSRGRAVETAEM